MRQIAAPASASGVTDHGALSGLGDDDHAQYLLADGSRNISGPIIGDDATFVDLTSSGKFSSKGINDNATSTGITINSSQVVTVANSIVSGSAGSYLTISNLRVPGFARKNVIINGGMAIWQRGTAQTALSTQYLADRWGKHQFQNSMITRQSFVQSGAHPGDSQYVMRASGDGSGTTRCNVGQGIELSDTVRFRGKTVTFSGYVRCSAATMSTATGNLSAIVGYSNSSNNGPFTSTNYTADGTTSNLFTPGSFPTTWTKFSTTLTISSTAQNIAVIVQFDNSSTLLASDWYELSNLQLEVGTVATEFEYRPIGEEFALCQRYFEKSFNLETTPASGFISPYRSATATNATFVELAVDFKVKKRGTPSVVFYAGADAGATDKWAFFNGAWVAATLVTPVRPNQTEFTVSLAATTTAAFSHVVSGHWTADAEL